MNYDLLFLVLFYIFLLIIFKIFRKKFEVQGKVFVLYKTNLGIKLMDKLAKKFPKTLNVFGYISVITGFIGMTAAFIFILYETLKYIFVPNTEAALAPLLPGVTINSSLPVLSFWHWILAILVVATVHEFSHGVYARLRKIKIKSSGFAFLGPILAAFVEPDEKQLKKKPVKDQLFVFSAGPFSNIILAGVVLLILAFIFVPIGNGITQVKGIIIGDINETLPINNSGLVSGEVIQEVNGIKMDDVNNLAKLLDKKSPGDIVDVKANDTFYKVKLSANPKNNTRAILGIAFSNYKIELKDQFKPFSWLYKVYQWLGLLFFWIFNISLGVGLFNLLPLGPVDGGRMFHAVMFKLTKNEKKALRILNYISLLILLMVLINLLPFILRLLRFIVSPFF